MAMTQPQPQPRAGAWLDHVGGRKFLLAAVVILVASVALFLGLLDGGQWLYVVGAAIGSYSAANAATHWSYRPPATPKITHPPLGGIASTDEDDLIDESAG